MTVQSLQVELCRLTRIETGSITIMCGGVHLDQFEATLGDCGSERASNYRSLAISFKISQDFRPQDNDLLTEPSHISCEPTLVLCFCMV